MEFDDLSSEQKVFVKVVLSGQSCLVDACIGSGKTTAIQVLCNQMPADKQILYLTYNRLLKVDARNKIKRHNVRVTNYHGFAMSELLRSHICSSVRECIPMYLRANLSIPHYDLLVLDEYQDINDEISELLWYIKSSNPDVQIAVVGDMSQKIYDTTRLDVSAFIHNFLPAGYFKIEFTQCFRISKGHAADLSMVWGKEIVGVNPDCDVCYMDRKEVFDYASKCNPGDLLCLGKNGGMRDHLLNSLEKLYPSKFNKHTIWSKINNRDGGSVDPTEGVGIFTTYDGCKGMERDVCILFDWDVEYWTMRLNMPQANYAILRNIFCVAASRGKRKIIFVKTNHTMLTPDVLMLPPLSHTVFKDVAIGSMFDFKYTEDVEDAFAALQIQEISDEKQVIDIEVRDGLIDLSPCISIYQNAVYFERFNIDKDIDAFFELNPDKKYLDLRKKSGFKSWTVEQKVLYLVSLQTNQNRYWLQVMLPFVTEEQKKAVCDRLSSRLSSDCFVQRMCHIPFYFHHEIAFSATGFINVVADDLIYELKFVSELSHVHFLQCAMYLIASDKSSGLLWNVRNDQIFQIQVPDRKLFLDRVVKTITKGAMREYHEC